MARSSTTKKVLMTLNVLVIVGLMGATGYLFMENRDLNDQANLTTEQQNERLVAEINEVYDLPDETPIVAIVTDVDEFKSQYTSFDNAQQGDYLLFFRKNRLNVLYRQSERRVVKTADVAVPISVELIGTQAAVDRVEDELAEFGNQIDITKKIDSDISQSFVFDVDDDQSSETKSIADFLGYDIGTTLPSSLVPDTLTEIVIAVADDVSTPTADPEQPEVTPEEN